MGLRRRVVLISSKIKIMKDNLGANSENDTAKNFSCETCFTVSMWFAFVANDYIFLMYCANDMNCSIIKSVIAWSNELYIFPQKIEIYPNKWYKSSKNNIKV